MVQHNPIQKFLSLYKNDRVTFFFEIGMWWRILYGIARIALGLSLLHFVGMPFSDMFGHIMHHEIIEDQHDILIQFISMFFTHFPFRITYFVAIYLMFWGTTDTILSISLLKEKKWAFPVGITLLAFFVMYEIFRFFHTHSLILLSIISIDIFLIWLIRQEYLKRFGLKKEA